MDWASILLNLGSGGIGVAITLVLTGFWNWRDRRTTRRSLEVEAILNYVRQTATITHELNSSHARHEDAEGFNSVKPHEVVSRLVKLDFLHSELRLSVKDSEIREIARQNVIVTYKVLDWFHREHTIIEKIDPLPHEATAKLSAEEVALLSPEERDQYLRKIQKSIAIVEVALAASNARGQEFVNILDEIWRAYSHGNSRIITRAVKKYGHRPTKFDREIAKQSESRLPHRK